MTLQPTLAAVVVAYVVIAVVVMIAFTVAYKLWPRGAFQPGSYDVTMSWNLLSLVLGFLAAVLGGWICVMIDDQPWAARSLMIVVAVLGLVDVAATVKKSTAGSLARGDEVDNRTAMRHARKPVWVAVTNILVGVAGVAVADLWLT